MKYFAKCFWCGVELVMEGNPEYGTLCFCVPCLEHYKKSKGINYDKV